MISVFGTVLLCHAAALNDIYVLQFEKGNFSILSWKKCMLTWVILISNIAIKKPQDTLC